MLQTILLVRALGMLSKHHHNAFRIEMQQSYAVCCDHFGATWVYFGPSWAMSGLDWRHFGRLGGHLCPIWGLWFKVYSIRFEVGG